MASTTAPESPLTTEIETRKEWVAPEFTDFACAPEVTAYAGV